MISNLSLLRPQRVSRRSSTTGIFARGSGSKRTSCHRGRKPCARLGTSLSSAFLSFVATPLLRVCYDRAPRHRLALTFVLSALWHGVYPGYYFTFITAIPITIAARAVSIRQLQDIATLVWCNLRDVHSSFKRPLSLSIHPSTHFPYPSS